MQDAALPSVGALVAEAARDFAQGNIEASIAALSAAGARDPDHMPVVFMAALVAWRLGDTAKALMLARRCFEQAPMNGTVAEIVASLYAQTGNLTESLYYGKLAIALPVDATLAAWLPPNFPTFDAAFLTIQDTPLLAHAQRLLAAGKLEEALDKARQHVEVSPDDADGRLFYGTALLRAGRDATALEILMPLADAAEPPPPAASALARAFAAVGEAASARQWHDAAVLGAPEDGAIAASRIADAPWLGVDAVEHTAWRAAWRTRFVQPGKPRQRRRSGEKLVIGYVVSAFADPQDAAAVASVARAHARPGTTVIGYGIGAQSWNENVLLRGAFDSWRDVSGLDPATLAKTVAGDGVDVVIDVGGTASAVNLQALARINTALRVAWLSDPAGLETAIYDAAIAPPAHAAIEAWPAPAGGYPLLRDWTREREHAPADARCRFGADIRLSQIDERTRSLWCAVLEAAPAATLLLRANDMATPANINRLVERFGRQLSARIDVVDAPTAESFYRTIDVALAPVVAVSARMAGEALACGVPLLALDDGGLWQPYPRLLRDLGLGDFVAGTADAYVAQAAALAGSAERRAAAATRVAPVADRGQGSAGAIASAIEAAARAALRRIAA
jgi:protein O-GlcNAc transferase